MDDPVMPAAVPLALIVAGRRHPPVVYFVRVPGGVKVGTSTNLAARMRAMLLPLADVLAVAPGGEDVEAAYHDLFRPWQVRDGRGDEIFDVERFLGCYVPGRRRRAYPQHAMSAAAPESRAQVRQRRIVRWLGRKPDGATWDEISHLFLPGAARSLPRPALNDFAADLAVLRDAGRVVADDGRYYAGRYRDPASRHDLIRN